MTVYDVPIKNVWFRLILIGKKTVEGKKNSPSWSGVRVGDYLKFTDESNGDSITKMVDHISYYPDVASYLADEGLDVTLPGITTIQNGLDIYLKPTGFWDPSDVEEFGIVAFHLK